MRWVCLLTRCRDILREQHQLSEEIGAAITSVPLGEQPDEEDLDAELEGLEQEAMDERMLNTGPVPVNTQLDRLPAAGTSDREYPSLPWQIQQKILTPNSKQRQGKTSRRRRRGSRAGQAARGNGHVASPSLLTHMFFLARICTPQFLVFGWVCLTTYALDVSRKQALFFSGASCSLYISIWFSPFLYLPDLPTALHSSRVVGSLLTCSPAADLGRVCFDYIGGCLCF